MLSIVNNKTNDKVRDNTLKFTVISDGDPTEISVNVSDEELEAVLKLLRRSGVHGLPQVDHSAEFKEKAAEAEASAGVQVVVVRKDGGYVWGDYAAHGFRYPGKIISRAFREEHSLKWDGKKRVMTGSLSDFPKNKKEMVYTVSAKSIADQYRSYIK